MARAATPTETCLLADAVRWHTTCSATVPRSGDRVRVTIAVTEADAGGVGIQLVVEGLDADGLVCQEDLSAYLTGVGEATVEADIGDDEVSAWRVTVLHGGYAAYRYSVVAPEE